MSAEKGFTTAPPTDIKKYRKWKKEIYRKVEYQLKEKRIDIEKISPYYKAKTGEIKDSELLSIFSRDSANASALKTYPQTRHRGVIEKLHIKMFEHLMSLIVIDRAINDYGMNDGKALVAREECIYDISGSTNQLSTKCKYEFLESICAYGGLSKLAEAKICWDCYYENNDMKSDYSYKIGKLLINRVDINNLNLMLDAERKLFEYNKELSIAQEMYLQDVVQMQEYLAKGELFYAYRGFLVNQDEYVREGRKADGEAYYQWKSGKGLSFSFDKNTAFYFCYWQMLFQELGGKWDLNNAMTRIPDTLRTKEEWIQHYTDINEKLIDRTGKKAIVGRFMIEPTTIAMVNMAKGEQEINVAPEKVVLVDYEIVSARKIAEAMWDRKYSLLQDISELRGCLDTTKIAMLPIKYDDGTMRVYFAETEAIRDEVDKCKQEFLSTNNFAKFDGEIRDIFIKNAVELPQTFNPQKSPTRRFLDFITRNEERLVRRNAHSYITKKR